MKTIAFLAVAYNAAYESYLNAAQNYLMQPGEPGIELMGMPVDPSTGLPLRTYTIGLIPASQIGRMNNDPNIVRWPAITATGGATDWDTQIKDLSAASASEFFGAARLLGVPVQAISGESTYGQMFDALYSGQGLGAELAADLDLAE